MARTTTGMTASALAAIAMLAWSSTACGGKAEPSQRTEAPPTPGAASTPSPPARVTPTPSSTPLDSFATEAAAAGLIYTPPVGFAPTAVRANRDVAYDHAVVSADGRVELRYALRPYPTDGSGPRGWGFSSTFFLTAILNITRGGSSGEAQDPAGLPAADFAADRATMTIVRWFAADGPADAFATGFVVGGVMLLHRDDLGDAYVFALVKDPDAADQLSEDAFRSLAFRPR